MTSSFVQEIIKTEAFTKENIVKLLSLSPLEAKADLFPFAKEMKLDHVGNAVFFRGLIEYSNICSKDCFYCGIRSSNANVNRYQMNDEEVLDAAMYAYKNHYGSIVIQAGEVEGEAFTSKIEELLKKIEEKTNKELRVTLSLGEQSLETYQRWFLAGAHRYLLRIETSSKSLYQKIHPIDENHNFDRRIQALRDLKQVGYQVGSGIMIGLPFQTLEDLANDLLFLKELDIDMCGMGPYIEHEDTPLYQYKDQLISKQDRFDLALRTLAVLRLMMKDINIASATALQAIDPAGREKALDCGTNVVMPNLTPTQYREGYQLYENKPCLDEDRSLCSRCLETRIKMFDHYVAFDASGDAPHFQKRSSK